MLEKFDSSELSVIIPLFNEEGSIGNLLKKLTETKLLQNIEIIVIDDGSTDKSVEIVEKYHNVRLVKHRVNRGYGAAITTGIRHAGREFLVWIDGDGQHRIDDLIGVSSALINQNLDYCIGVRDNRSHHEKSRALGKFILKTLVNIAAGQRIADFNSGLRGFKTSVIQRYTHLLPMRFGASTVTTLLMKEQKHIGMDIPIVVEKRIGTSTVRQIRDGFLSTLVILRVVLLFKPLIFFGSIGGILVVAGSIYGIIKTLLVGLGFPTLASLTISLGVQTFFFGILADQISLMRRERLNHFEIQQDKKQNDFILS